MGREVLQLVEAISSNLWLSHQSINKSQSIDPRKSRGGGGTTKVLFYSRRPPFVRPIVGFIFLNKPGKMPKSVGNFKFHVKSCALFSQGFQRGAAGVNHSTLHPQKRKTTLQSLLLLGCLDLIISHQGSALMLLPR